MKNLFTLIFLFCCLTIKAQDSTKVFTPQEFLWMVENYHPIVNQAKLLKQKGESSVRRARGAFDPKLFTYFDNKYFDDKTYYRLLNSGLKIPTWYGLEVKAGFDQNRGVFLNPEDNLPNSGLLYGGVSLTLGNGLFIDNRRASLKQAQIYAESTVEEQNLMLNNLYFEALSHYWDWVKTYHQMRVYQTSLNLAKTRFEGVKQSYLFGENPAIDTLEAFIQVQNRALNSEQYQLKYKNATLELSNYLWGEDLVPLEISDSIRPPNFESNENLEQLPKSTIDTILLNIEELNPELKLYDYKLSSFDIERRLKQEQLKPRINVNYNLLNEPVGSSLAADLSMQNYKWGLEFSFPLFLRKERGDLALTKLKINEVGLQREQKTLTVKNKVEQYFNKQNTTFGQVELYTSAVQNYYDLLKGEREKFKNGESTLFLINSREINAIDAELTLIALQANFEKYRLGILWAAGILNEK